MQQHPGGAATVRAGAPGEGYGYIGNCGADRLVYNFTRWIGMRGRWTYAAVAGRSCRVDIVQLDGLGCIDDEDVRNRCPIVPASIWSSVQTTAIEITSLTMRLASIEQASEPRCCCGVLGHARPACIGCDDEIGLCNEHV